jgi:hypothetical protein
MGLLGRLLLRRSGAAEVPGGLEGAGAMMAQAEGLQKEIAEIVARHGFDPSRPAIDAGDPADVTEMQREIMEAMRRRGFPVPGMAAPPPRTTGEPAPTDGPIRDPLGP